MKRLKTRSRHPNLVQEQVMLSPEAKQMIIDNYRGRFHKYGAGPKVAEWNSVESQEMRFEQLCRLGDMQGASILDIGCGIADMYPYLLEKFGTIKYTGVDLVQETIDHARQAYAASDAVFICQDIINDPLPEDMRFDYVTISGIFNNDVPHAVQFLETMTKVAFGLALKGLGFNFLSTYRSYQDFGAFYHDPVAVLRHCLERLSKKTTLFHHYGRADVSVFVYR